MRRKALEETCDAETEKGVQGSEQFTGDILIYVEGYRVEDWRCMPHNYPEDAFPFPENSGWAVGDNPRDRYCSRLAVDKLRRFKDYDAAVAYIQAKRRKRKKERFQLIYQLGNSFHEVSMLDEIQAIDADATAANEVERAYRAELKKEFEKDFPGLDVLRKVATSRTAMAASDLLGKIRKQGIDEARKAYPKASFYRLMKLLREAGLWPA